MSASGPSMSSGPTSSNLPMMIGQSNLNCMLSLHDSGELKFIKMNIIKMAAMSIQGKTP